MGVTGKRRVVRRQQRLTGVAAAYLGHPKLADQIRPPLGGDPLNCRARIDARWRLVASQRRIEVQRITRLQLADRAGLESVFVAVGVGIAVGVVGELGIKVDRCLTAVGRQRKRQRRQRRHQIGVGRHVGRGVDGLAFGDGQVHKASVGVDRPAHTRQVRVGSDVDSERAGHATVPSVVRPAV